jgi:hypothetical protein
VAPFRASNKADDQIALQNEQCPISGHPAYTYLKAGNFVNFATITGTLLILLSILGFSWGGFNFMPEQKNAGGVLVKHTSTLPIPPIISMASLIAGIGLAAIGMRYKMA